MTDKEKFLDTARTYVLYNGDFVCNTKLNLGYITHWCAYAVSAIMKDCGFISKYIKEVEGGAGSIPRSSDGIYGAWFKKFIPNRINIFVTMWESLRKSAAMSSQHLRGMLTEAIQTGRQLPFLREKQDICRIGRCMHFIVRTGRLKRNLQRLPRKSRSRYIN